MITLTIKGANVEESINSEFKKLRGILGMSSKAYTETFAREITNEMRTVIQEHQLIHNERGGLTSKGGIKYRTSTTGGRTSIKNTIRIWFIPEHHAYYLLYGRERGTMTPDKTPYKLVKGRPIPLSEIRKGKKAITVGKGRYRRKMFLRPDQLSVARFFYDII